MTDVNVDEPNIRTKTFAAELDALVSSAEDPLTRFIRSIQDDRLRAYVEETVKLRQELLINTQRMLVASLPSEVSAYASWIAKNAHQVAYRWFELRQSLERWMSMQASPLYIRKPGI